MDQVKDDHATEEVAKLHAPVQVQEEDLVVVPLRPTFHLIHVDVEEKWTDHVEEDRVDESERDYNKAEDLRDQDKTR